MFAIHDLFDLQEISFKKLLIAFESPWALLTSLKEIFKELALGQIEGELESGVHLVHPELISIGKGTTVEAGSYIVGPCVIGENCQIRHGAYLRGYVLAADKVVIGHATEAKHSILLNQAQAGHFAYIGDSILGNRVNLGAGTKCANLRFDHASIKIQGVDTGLRKLGAILADDSQTGCNSVTNPGTILLPGAYVAPCKSAKGIVKRRLIHASV